MTREEYNNLSIWKKWRTFFKGIDNEIVFAESEPQPAYEEEGDDGVGYDFFEAEAAAFTVVNIAVGYSDEATGDDPDDPDWHLYFVPDMWRCVVTDNRTNKEYVAYATRESKAFIAALTLAHRDGVEFGNITRVHRFGWAC